jgi:peptidoglycan/LPS O-acetylase OafA/YrhL
MSRAGLTLAVRRNFLLEPVQPKLQGPIADSRVPHPVRIEFLDGLRGLAILLVMLFHAFVRWPEVVPYGDAYAGNFLLANGWLGVQLFFLISGFVIFMTLEKCHSFADFAFRRWLRLFPGMLICSLLILATAAFFHERPSGAVGVRDLLPGVTFIEPAFWEQLTGAHQGMLEGAFWSLFVEVKFYAIAGFCYFLFGARATVFVLCAAFAGTVILPRLHDAAGAGQVLALLNLVDARFFGWFGSGALLFYFFRTRDLRCLLLGGTVGVAAAYFQPEFMAGAKWIPLLVVVIFCAAVAFTSVQRVLGNRPMLVLGFVSYPLYLLHENIMVSLIVKLHRLVPAIPSIALPVIPILLIVAVAWLVATYGEPRLRSWLRRSLQPVVARVPDITRIRTLAGVIVLELPRYVRWLFPANGNYLAACNRNEQLEPAPSKEGYRCLWQWTSDLHAPKHLPYLGDKLAQRAFADHPVRRRSEPAQTQVAVEVSFVVGHRGVGRIPHLLATLESIAGQEGIAVECLVIDQDSESHLIGLLPQWVRHVHAPQPSPEMPYCRSWAFNVGARNARGRLLVLHDNDMLVPFDFAASLLRRVNEGFELVNLKRFIFFLEEVHTGKLFANSADLLASPPASIMQNAQGGGSIAITREAFDRIGGMDESFIGWGGEDNEFWERAQTLRVWPYANLPIWHLWHAAQPGKYQLDNETLKRYQALSAIPVAERIAALLAVERGLMSGPSGWPQ